MKIGEFFFLRDETNRSHVGWFDINLDDPSLILDVSTKPMLKPGPVGRFDGNGIYASSAVRLKNDSLVLHNWMESRTCLSFILCLYRLCRK